MTRLITRASINDPLRCTQALNARSPTFFSNSLVIDARYDLLEEMTEAAKRLGKNVRYCLHCNADDLLHEMVVLQFQDQYFPPKKHPAKAKSFRVVEGELGLFVFGDAGELLDAARLRPGKSLVYRVSANVFHADIPLTANAIHIETTLGPFTGEHDRIVAEWAPSRDDGEAFQDFRKRLVAALDAGPG